MSDNYERRRREVENPGTGSVTISTDYGVMRRTQTTEYNKVRVTIDEFDSVFVVTVYQQSRWNGDMIFKSERVLPRYFVASKQQSDIK